MRVKGGFSIRLYCWKNELIWGWLSYGQFTLGDYFDGQLSLDDERQLDANG